MPTNGTSQVRLRKTPKERKAPHMRHSRPQRHHFSLKARSRDFSMIDLKRLSDDELCQLAYRARFAATDGRPVCPKCGSEDYYVYPCKTKFSCRPKNHSYSLTGGTVLANSKLSLEQIIVAAHRFATSVKGVCAIQTSHFIGCTYEAAHKLNMRFREAIAYETEGMILRGTVHIDGAVFGGTVRKANVGNHAGKRNSKKIEVLMTITELHGRTLTNVFKSEAESVFWILKSVHPSATIFTDMAGSLGVLAERYDRRVRQINHSESFSERGINTNYAESRFAAARRAEWGIYHHMSDGGRLIDYGRETAWHHDHRHKTDRGKFDQLINGAFAPR